MGGSYDGISDVESSIKLEGLSLGESLGEESRTGGGSYYGVPVENVVGKLEGSSGDIYR